MIEPRDLHLLLLGASWALSLAVAVVAWRDPRLPRDVRGLVLGLAACGAAYSLLPAPLGATWTSAGRMAWRALAAPGVLLLWLLVRRLFDDGFRLRPAHAAAGAALSLAGAAAPRLLSLAALAVAVHLLWRLAVGWSEDLDLGRRRLRGLLAGAGSAVVIVAVSGGTAAAGSALLAAQSLVKLAWLALLQRAALWSHPAPALPTQAATDEPSPATASLPPADPLARRCCRRWSRSGCTAATA